MRVLFYVNHPVDPYVVFNCAQSLKDRGEEVFFVILEKESIIRQIVEAKGFENTVIGTTQSSFLGKILNSFKIVPKIRSVVRSFRPDIVFSPRTPYVSFALANVKTHLIAWEDTETGTFSYNNSIWRIDSLLMPDSFYLKKNSEKIIRFNGYKELAYLHPKQFTPNRKVIQKLGLNESDKIVLMRFSALKAMHDQGLDSVAVQNEAKILDFIHRIEKLYDAKVFISMTERSLDAKFEKYCLNIQPEEYSHFLSFCSLYLGEGTTTASEAGVLGVPWINIQKTQRGYLIDQEENYGLGKRIEDIDTAFKEAESYLKRDTRLEWKQKREKLLQDKINVSDFITWFTLNYPSSRDDMRVNPEIQNQFK
jgi:predicted glycosyltransferase